MALVHPPSQTRVPAASMRAMTRSTPAARLVLSLALIAAAAVAVTVAVATACAGGGSASAATSKDPAAAAASAASPTASSAAASASAFSPAQTPSWSADDLEFFLHGSMGTEFLPERVLTAMCATYPDLFPGADLAAF